MALLTKELVRKDYFTNIYKCTWESGTTPEEIIESIDKCNYGGVVRLEAENNGICKGTVNVYID